MTVWDNIPHLPTPCQTTPVTTPQPTLVLDRVLHLLRPLVRLLVGNGVTYPVLAAALKRVFLDAARAELAERGMAATDSAVTLLCGVHRRDVRTLTRAAPEAPPPPAPLGLAAQVVARWLNAPGYQAEGGGPRPLPRSGPAPSFDALVAGASRDVRPRAVLEELLRLGVARADEREVTLASAGFAPRQGLPEMCRLMADNLHDHAAAAAANLRGEANFLEQALFVDGLAPASAAQLHRSATQAWREAARGLLAQAQAHSDADATAPAGAPRQRVRFGVYFYAEDEPRDEAPAPP